MGNIMPETTKATSAMWWSEDMALEELLEACIGHMESVSIDEFEWTDWTAPMRRALALARASLDKKRELKEEYHDLLMAVGTKYDGESRHETARRYILEAERRSMGDGKATLRGAESPSTVEHPEARPVGEGGVHE